MSMPLPLRQPAQDLPVPAPSAEAKAPLSRLAALHQEAEEVAQLANLLGRSIQTGAALVCMAAAVLVLTAPAMAEGAAWATFVCAAAGAIAVIYRSAILRPFERPALITFFRDFKAAMFFAGAAWGAGAFLALPADANIGAVVLFVAGAGTIVALILREPESTAFFLAPAAAMVAAASLLKPLQAGFFGAAFVLVACAALGISAAAGGRWLGRSHDSGDLAGLPQA